MESAPDGTQLGGFQPSDPFHAWSGVRLVARLRIADGRSRLAAALATAFYLPVPRNAFDLRRLGIEETQMTMHSFSHRPGI